MGSKNPTQTTTQNQSSKTKYSGTSTVTPNSQVMPYYQTALTDVSNAAATPYTAYTGDLTAMTNPYQQGVYGNIQNIPGVINPYYAQAQQYMQPASHVTGPTFSADQLQPFMNPFTQNVIDATRANMQQNNAVNDERLKGNAIAAGAWGGDRAGVARAEQMKDQSLSDNQTIAGLYQNNFDQAMQNYWTQAGMGQQAALANQSADLQANAANAGIVGNFGNMALNAANSGAQLGMQAGTQQQQTQQSFLDALYKQWQIAQQYPFNTAQWEAELLPGLGGAMGSTTTSSGKSNTTGTGTSNTQLPAPSPVSQIAGGLLTAASFFNRGGAVPHAAGGGLFGDSWMPGLGGWDWGSPSMNASSLAGAPGASGKSYQWTPEDLAGWQDGTSTWVPEGSQAAPGRKWNDYNKGVANFGMSLMQPPKMVQTPQMDFAAPQIPQIQAQPIQSPQMPQNVQAPSFAAGGLIPHMGLGGLPYEDPDIGSPQLGPVDDMMPKGISPWDFDRAVRTAATETRSPQGQRNVVSVGKNRAAEADMGLASVFTAPKQFSVWNPDINTANNVSPDQWQKTAENILPTYTGEAPDATGGADHYHASYVDPYWAKGQTPLGMGDDGHIFYKLGYEGGEPTDSGAPTSLSPATSTAAADDEGYFDNETLNRLQRPLGDSYKEMYQQLYGDKDKEKGRLSNRQMALLAAGLGMMAGTSPYAAANIGEGGLAGVKVLSDLRGTDDEREAKVMQLAIQQRNDEMEAARWHAMMKHYQNQDINAANKITTPGGKARDTAFAKEYVDWTTNGGSATTRSQLSALQGAINNLDSSDKISGPVVGSIRSMLSPGMERWAFPEAVKTQQDIENVIQSSLRQVLGAQFTENEGVRLMARTFDPNAEESVNKERAMRLLNRIKEMADAKDDAARWFEEHNESLEGWQGHMPSLGDLDTIADEAKAGTGDSGGDKPKKVPDGAIKYLQQHPETRDTFEKRYGVSADDYLGG